MSFGAMPSVLSFDPSIERFDMLKVAAYVRSLYRMLDPEDFRMITEVPFIDCEPGMCSEASAAMVLQYLGKAITAEKIHNMGYDTIDQMTVFFREWNGRYTFGNPWSTIINMLDEGAPVPVRIWPDGQPGEHTVVVVGFSHGRYNPTYFYIHDCARGPFQKVRLTDFMREWNRSGSPAMRYYKNPEDAPWPIGRRRG